MRGFKLVAGRLDTRIEILHRINQRDPTFRTDKPTWLPFCTAWADVQDVLPSRGDRIADGIDISLRPCRVRLRWRADLSGHMRLRIRGVEYSIISGPVELGRREAIELIAQHVGTEGQKP